MRNVHHSHTRAPKWESWRLFSMLRHLRREDNRACTCSKVSFIAVKRWVMKNHQNLTENDDAKSRKNVIPEQHKQIRFFLRFSFKKTSQNRAPVWEWWRFQEKALKIPINLQFMFEHVFYWKIKFLQHSLRRVTNRKLCFLQLKLSNFMFYAEIADQK